jgi:hypothetical protein
VETKIREAAGLPAEAHGMPMVAKAFNAENGPLMLSTDPAGERQGMQQSMAGAVSLFKNPRSYRNGDLSDPKEAAEMLIIASHILRIVEPASASPPVKKGRWFARNRNRFGS